MKFGLFSTDPRVSVETLKLIAVALAEQSYELASWWESQPDTFEVYERKSDLPPGICEFEFMTELAEPDALADHTLGGNGRPRCEVGVSIILDNGGTLYTGSISVSAAASHEYVETKCDPYVAMYSDFSSDEEVALEVADPVEGDSYPINVGGKDVFVSNFVGARWFSNPGIPNKGPFDRMRRLSAPLTMSPGGYLVLRKGGPAGTYRQVFGEAMPDFMRAHKEKHNRRARHLRQIEKSIEDTKP